MTRTRGNWVFFPSVAVTTGATGMTAAPTTTGVATGSPATSGTTGISPTATTTGGGGGAWPGVMCLYRAEESL